MDEAEGPALIQLVYASAAAADFGVVDLDQILRAARTNNQRAGVTGVLLFESGSFFQVLEGLPEDVDKIFERISGDPRHSRVVMLLKREVSTRLFGDWTMGYARMTLGELSSVIGINDFFQEGECFSQLDSSQAKKLMGSFREGSYRQRIA